MFQFIGLSSLRMVYLLYTGLPHSDTHGSRAACASPWLFAAYRVLRRLLTPRHPPYALSNLTIFRSDDSNATASLLLERLVAVALLRLLRAFSGAPRICITLVSPKAFGDTQILEFSCLHISNRFRHTVLSMSWILKCHKFTSSVVFTLS